MEVNVYLEEVFGENISMQQFEDTNYFPKYLLDNYDFYQCTIQEKNYTFLFVKENKFIISQLKKQLDKMQSLNMKYPVLIINHTRREIRNKLIANRIPFIEKRNKDYRWNTGS